MQNSTRNKINLLFSSFLIIGYIICAYFFSSLAAQVAGALGSLLYALILLLFGLLLFWATRVGEGKQVRRFSLAVLLLIDLPCAYIIAASLIAGMPFHDQLSSVTTVMSTGSTTVAQPIIMMLASVALGYAVPYTFLSGYEMKTDDAEETEEIADELPEEAPAEEIAESDTEADLPAEEAEAEEKAEEKAEEDAAAEAEAELKIEVQEIQE